MHISLAHNLAAKEDRTSDSEPGKGQDNSRHRSSTYPPHVKVTRSGMLQKFAQGLVVICSTGEQRWVPGHLPAEAGHDSDVAGLARPQKCMLDIPI